MSGADGAGAGGLSTVGGQHSERLHQATHTSARFTTQELLTSGTFLLTVLGLGGQLKP